MSKINDNEAFVVEPVDSETAVILVNMAAGENITSKCPHFAECKGACMTVLANASDALQENGDIPLRLDIHCKESRGLFVHETDVTAPASLISAHVDVGDNILPERYPRGQYSVLSEPIQTSNAFSLGRELENAVDGVMLVSGASENIVGLQMIEAREMRVLLTASSKEYWVWFSHLSAKLADRIVGIMRRLQRESLEMSRAGEDGIRTMNRERIIQEIDALSSEEKKHIGITSDEDTAKEQD